MRFALIAFGVGVVSGLRTLTAFTIASWAARLGRLPLQGSWLAFLGYAATPWIMSLAAMGELVNDKLPKTPSRKTPPQFAARILFGSATGAAIGIASGMIAFGLLLGALGAVAGTLIGAWARARLVNATGGKDLPIALMEDATAIGLSLLLLFAFSS
jgi:uncharacterized membrane protein